MDKKQLKEFEDGLVELLFLGRVMYKKDEEIGWVRCTQQEIDELFADLKRSK